MCEYRQLRNGMLQDRVEAGIKDLALSEQLQEDTDLGLEKWRLYANERLSTNSLDLYSRETTV